MGFENKDTKHQLSVKDPFTYYLMLLLHTKQKTD